MTEGDMLLRAVLASPEDDTPRLVYADWLEENDRGKQAEYIREMVACDSGDYREQRARCISWDMMSGEPADPDAAHRPTLTEITGLMNADKRDDGWECQRWYWRGFVERIALPLGAFLNHAKAIFRTHPVVSVRLTCRAPRQDGPKTWHWYTHPRYNRRGMDRSRPVRPSTSTNLILYDFVSFLTSHRNKNTFTGHAGYHNFNYATAELAYDDLSRACVGYGRWLAGLPKMDWGQETQEPA